MRVVLGTPIPDRGEVLWDVDPAPIEAKVASAVIHLQVLDPNAKVRTERQVVAIFVAILLCTNLSVSAC